MKKTGWNRFIEEKILSARNQSQYRSLRTLDTLQPGYVLLEGERYLNLSSNDYLGLCSDPFTQEEARLLAEILPFGAGASRLITGTLAIHTELEKLLREWKRTEAALVFPTGFQTNVGVIQALTGKADVIFSDRLNHASIIDGCLLSGARLIRYQHCDMEDLNRQLQSQTARRRVIISDAVFSMDGDLAPLKELNRLAQEYEALLIVDEAHATGVLGKDGAGLWSHFKLKWDEHVILMGTLSKAIGVQGGFICASQNIVDFLVNYCRSFIYTTALSPFQAAIAHYHISRIRSEPERLKNLKNAMRTMRQELGGQGILVSNDPTPIIPIITGDSRQAVEMARHLEEQKILGLPIRPPTVPEGSARLRISVSAVHDPDELKRAAQVIGERM
ncbi:MAG: 8-amino-7-oxononanoate synthase [bacterium]